MMPIDAATAPNAAAGECPIGPAIFLFLKSDGPGGVEQVALRLADGWRAEGIVTHILFARPVHSWAGGSRVASPWPVIGNGLPHLRLLLAMLRDIIHCAPGGVLFCAGNSYAGIAVALKLLLGRRCPPIVAKISNDLARPDMLALTRVVYHAWLWLQGRLIDHVAVLSAPMAREVQIRMRLPAHRVHIVPNPVLSHDSLMLLPVPSRDVARTGRRFVAVGRLERQKDYATMLRAFAAGARADDRLTIFGTGRERAPLMAFAGALGIASRVHFAGHCADVRDQLANHDILLLSSRYEGQPSAIVEALAAGLCVIATGCCAGMADLLDHGALGHMVTPGDVDGFAQAIAQAIPGAQDRERARIKASASTIEAAIPAYAALFAAMDRPRAALATPIAVAA